MGLANSAERTEIKPIFGLKDPSWGDPKLFLLDRVLAQLPIEQRVADIADAIEACWQSDKVNELVEGLGKILEAQPVEYRRQLRQIYGRLPKKGTIGSYYIDDERHQADRKGDLAPKLKIKIVGEVIKGWGKGLIYVGKTYESRYELNEDAEDCYRFVCDTYQEAEYKGPIRPGVLGVFKSHLQSRRSYGSDLDFTPTQLNPWILKDFTPDDFALAMGETQLQLQHPRQRLADIKRAATANT